MTPNKKKVQFLPACQEMIVAYATLFGLQLAGDSAEQATKTPSVVKADHDQVYRGYMTTTPSIALACKETR